jgi:hypothetical protein
MDLENINKISFIKLSAIVAGDIPPQLYCPNIVSTDLKKNLFVWICVRQLALTNIPCLIILQTSYALKNTSKLIAIFIINISIKVFN